MANLFIGMLGRCWQVVKRNPTHEMIMSRQTKSARFDIWAGAHSAGVSSGHNSGHTHMVPAWSVKVGPTHAINNQRRMEIFSNILSWPEFHTSPCWEKLSTDKILIQMFKTLLIQVWTFLANISISALLQKINIFVECKCYSDDLVILLVGDFLQKI